MHVSAEFTADRTVSLGPSGQEPRPQPTAKDHQRHALALMRGCVLLHQEPSKRPTTQQSHGRNRLQRIVGGMSSKQERLRPSLSQAPAY